MPRKKQHRVITALGFAFAIAAIFFMLFGLFATDEGSIIDYLYAKLGEEEDRANDVVDTGNDLREPIQQGIEKPDTSDETADAGGDQDGTADDKKPDAGSGDGTSDDNGDEVDDTGSEVPDSSEASEPEPEPDPEPEDDIDFFEHFTQGIGVLSYKYNSVGDTARGTTNAQPYVFVKVSGCGMRVDIRSMPTPAFPGKTAKEGLATIFQTDYVDQAPSSENYEIIKEPYDLELNGAPAARLEAWHTTSKSTYLLQLTAIRGETRSGTVQGQMLESCAEKPDSVSYLNEMTDSVELFEPHPVCYVGHVPDSDPAQYSVGCDDLKYNFVGIDVLADEGFTEIMLGPVTWDECAEFMREHDQEYW